MAGTHNERGQFILDSNRREIRREKGKGKKKSYTILGNLGGGRSNGELKRMAEDREGWRLSNL